MADTPIEYSRSSAIVASFYTEIRANAAERSSCRVSGTEFPEAAGTILKLCQRCKSSKGLTALFCVCWAPDPTRFNLPVTGLYAFVHEHSRTSVQQINGEMLGHGDYIEQLELYLGEDRVQCPLETAPAQLALPQKYKLSLNPVFHEQLNRKQDFLRTEGPGTNAQGASFPSFLNKIETLRTYLQGDGHITPMKHLSPSSLETADALAGVSTPLPCPARMDQGLGNACACHGIQKKLCKLERGIISWKNLSYLELLELRQKHPSHPDLPNHDAASAFDRYWTAKSWQETGDTKGWKQIHSNQLPPRNTLLREDRLPLLGQYGAVDEHNNITERIETERFVMMLMEYIQTDRYGFFDVLSIDVDCDFDVGLLQAAGLPLPRYFVSRRRQSGDAPTFVRRPHLVFWLRRPVRRYKNERQTKAAQYFEAIRETFIQRLTDLGLNVDPKRPDLGKNPHHDAWDTVQGDYRDWSLRELHRALGPLKSPKASWQIEKSNRASATPLIYRPGDCPAGTSHDEMLLEGYAGRNDFIFNKARFHGYGLKRQKLDDAEIARRIDRFAHDLNEEQFATYSRGPLKPSEVDTCIRSVTDFVINRYEPGEDSKDRGACIREGLIDAGMTKRIKQGVGGKYAAGKNADRTRQRVQDAIEALGGWHHQISISALAEEAGVSRPTARKWRNIIAAERKAASAASATEVAKTVPIRKRDVIPAPSVEQVDLPGTAGLVLEGLALRLAQTSIRIVGSTSAANSPYKPLSVRKGSGKQALYRHPFNNSLVLTEGGDVLGAHIAKVENKELKRAPIHILDRAGFLDDSADEYAPPIGETDHLGNVRYDEGYHAPSRIGLQTWEWSDDEVDLYLSNLKLA